MASPGDQAAREERAARIGAILEDLYPDPPIPLDHTDNFTFLVAVMLSAQSTDKKVNEVTPRLFERAGSPQAMAAMEVEEIQALIQQVGLAPTKAKNLHAMAGLLVSRHGGEVPASFEELEALPGVGHKTASVLMTQAHGVPSFPVDTHIHRLAQRWRLVGPTKNVGHVEAALKSLYPEPRWRDLHLQIIYFGREHCPAQRHDPTGCPICSWAAAPDEQPELFPNSPGRPGAASTGGGKKGARGGKGAAKRSLATAVGEVVGGGELEEGGEEAAKAPLGRKKVKAEGAGGEEPPKAPRGRKKAKPEDAVGEEPPEALRGRKKAKPEDAVPVIKAKTAAKGRGGGRGKGADERGGSGRSLPRRSARGPQKG